MLRKVAWHNPQLAKLTSGFSHMALVGFGNVLALLAVVMLMLAR